MESRSRRELDVVKGGWLQNNQYVNNYKYIGITGNYTE
jgi:hypothetical protein